MYWYENQHDIKAKGGVCLKVTTKSKEPDFILISCDTLLCICRTIGFTGHREHTASFSDYCDFETLADIYIFQDIDN